MQPLKCKSKKCTIIPPKKKKSIPLNNNYLTDTQVQIEPTNVVEDFFDKLRSQSHSKTKLPTCICIICEHRIKRNKTTSATYFRIGSTCAQKAVLKHYAEILNDVDLLDRLKSKDTSWYHDKCWDMYRDVVSKALTILDQEEQRDEETHIVRGLHKVTYTVICNFIRAEIIEKEQFIHLHELHLQYKTIIETLNNFEPISSDNYDLVKKLPEDFENLVVDAEKNVVYKKGVNYASGRMVTTNVSWTYMQIMDVIMDIRQKKAAIHSNSNVTVAASNIQCQTFDMCESVG